MIKQQGWLHGRETMYILTQFEPMRPHVCQRLSILFCCLFVCVWVRYRLNLMIIPESKVCWGGGFLGLRRFVLGGDEGKKGCGLKLWDTWSAVYCLGNQTVDQSILEKLRVPVFLRSWKCWCNLYRQPSVIKILRLFVSLQVYNDKNNRRLQYFSVSLSFFHMTQIVHATFDKLYIWFCCSVIWFGFWDNYWEMGSSHKGTCFRDLR